MPLAFGGQTYIAGQCLMARPCSCPIFGMFQRLDVI